MISSYECQKTVSAELMLQIFFLLVKSKFYFFYLNCLKSENHDKTKIYECKCDMKNIIYSIRWDKARCTIFKETFIADEFGEPL
jgi:hypothetical protein